MVRRCSYCGNSGHNSRTCRNSLKNGSVAAAAGSGRPNLFGVKLDLSSKSSSCTSSCINNYCSMKKSFNMHHLSMSSSSASSSTPSFSNEYLCDGRLIAPISQERRKGAQWTEEEHHRFLIGLENLGKGDWSGISEKFVTTKTPTQVASHAQKYQPSSRVSGLLLKRNWETCYSELGLNCKSSFIKECLSFKPPSFCLSASSAPIDLTLKLASPTRPWDRSKACSRGIPPFH